MINAIIVDDEYMVGETLKNHIQNHITGITILSVINDVKNAKSTILKLAPDLVFLDIQMPGLNGFELLRSFEEINFDVIFTTAYTTYAIEAFKVHAFDYLLKPITIDELKTTVNRYYLKRRTYSDKQHITSFLEKIEHLSSKTERITIPEIGALTIIQTSDIICLKSDYGYTDVYCKDGSKITSSKPLKHFCEILKNNTKFCEIGKSNIVNLNYVTKYYNEGTIILENTIKISVPRRSRKTFLATLQQ
ncbi:LytR/AlgR family response regulator transcription factor [Tenacibaculum agarivorans]|uniref:LytR/AlgR family response regulator transcription factor n=1 Tax=Tenacibaculum agarivorans TaxID=1908389 RepID=UPI00094B9D94|nr:response regulator transcription factor [Tenacibaculum agarivorans]